MTSSRRHSSDADRQLAARVEATDDVEELTALGARCLSEEHPALAARAYRKALRRVPDDGVVHNNLGVALWDLAQKGPALVAFRRAAQLRPDDRNVVENVAGALADAGRVEEARRWFGRAGPLKRGRKTRLAYVDLHGY